MLLRNTDPFRDFDRLTQQRPRHHEPTGGDADGRLARGRHGSSSSSTCPASRPRRIDLDVERNVLTVRAERVARNGDWEMLASERPRGVFSRQLVLGDNLDLDRIEAGYDDGRAAPDDPGRGEGEAAQDRSQQCHWAREDSHRGRTRRRCRRTPCTAEAEGATPGNPTLNVRSRTDPVGSHTQELKGVVVAWQFPGRLGARRAEIAHGAAPARGSVRRSLRHEVATGEPSAWSRRPEPSGISQEPQVRPPARRPSTPHRTTRTTTRNRDVPVQGSP